MALSKERIGEIAMKLLQDQLEKKGLPMNPKEIRREIHNEAKNFGMTPAEFAEFAKLVYGETYTKLVAELDKIIAAGKVEG